jgi:hypothetical protein
VTDLLKEDEFKRKYPGAELSDFEDGERGDPLWFTENKIRIAEYWTRQEVTKKLLKLSNDSIIEEEEFQNIKDLISQLGITVSAERESTVWQVTQRIITGKEVLETTKWAGQYIPIVPVYGDELNIEGVRHFISLIRSAKDSQRMFNFWRTASTELVALAPKAPFIGSKGSFNSDAGKWATANTKSHAYIEYDGPNPPQRQPFSGVPAGAIQEALNAADDMKSIMGIFDASLGARSNETSGKAILARQREGDVSTFNFIDNLSRAIRHAGRILVDLIPHVYNVPRIIRIIHEDGKNEAVQINQQHMARDPNVEQQAGPQGEQEQREQQEFNAGMLKLYDLTVGKYDVTCESGPSFTTKREESAAQMMNFIQAVPGSAQLIGDLIAKNLDWPGAEAIADRLKVMLPQQVQGQNPQVMQMQQQIQQMGQQAKQAVDNLTHQLEQLKNDKVLEARKLDIDAYGKETDRLKVTGAAMSPDQIQMMVMQTVQNLLNSPDILPGNNSQQYAPQQAMQSAPMPQGQPIPNQMQQGPPPMHPGQQINQGV